MPSKLIGLFLEDFAQEQYIQAIARRIAGNRGCECVFRVFNSRGGRPAVQRELKLFFRTQASSEPTPDFLIIGNDGNCNGFVERRNELDKYVPSEWRDRTIWAIPDPHIEAWLFRDIEAFHRAVGSCNAPPIRKCDKNFYKNFLRDNTIKARGSALLGGIENVNEIAVNQDLTRLKASGADLCSFIEALEQRA